MKEYDIKEEMLQHEESSLPIKRKKFQGFSMSFLLVLLAVVVGLYIVCTLMTAK